HHIDGNPFIQQSRQIPRQVRRLGLPPLPELQEWLSLLECRIVDSMAAEQEHQVGAGTAHGTDEPENGVVLLLGGGAEGLIDNLQDFHGIYLVPMVRVLKASDAYRHRSGGPPRPQPSMTSLTPRSSTQRPQLIHSNCNSHLEAFACSEAIHSRVRGWASSPASRPWTALPWGCCLANDSATAPS